MGNREEREYKFDCDESTALATIDPAAVAYERDIDLHAVYWDTPDRRLLGRRVTVRYRESSDDPGEAWTVKLPVGRADGVVDRLEVAFGGPAEMPPNELVDLVSATMRGDRFAPIATIHTARHVVGARDDDGNLAAEIADDRVSGTTPDGKASKFRQVEVEVVGDDTSTADHLAKLLRDQGLSPSTSGSKLEQVVGETGTRDVVISALGPKSTVEDLVRYMFAVAVDTIIDRDPAIRVSDDPEAVHQARVATRKLRSNLQTLQPALIDEEIDVVRGELQWLGETLGAARDLDVLQMTIRHLLPTVGGDETSPAATWLLGRLAADRQSRRDELRVAMSGERYQELLRRLVAAAEHPVLRSDRTARRKARAVVRPLCRESWTRVARPLSSDQVGEPSDRVLHEVRKRAKRARYAAELAALVNPRSTPAFANEMKRYQDSLGGLQDCVTAQLWLQSVTRVGPDAEVAFLSGKLWTRLDDRKAQARSKFDRQWNQNRASRKAAWFH